MRELDVGSEGCKGTHAKWPRRVGVQTARLVGWPEAEWADKGQRRPRIVG